MNNFMTDYTNSSAEKSGGKQFGYGFEEYERIVAVK
jgi:hypothetical protein